ncbi:hypothetical protein Cgig2_024823 [Carnegiea gigantea]|uniref:Pectate lyase n=1 Tax=Carnegiea gigantea TaxID=171969 RepID=A0A9Q1KC05_9CARY|nr:hypothetical protein Cgig2_024823 [Carnegiea gigantea]
MAKITEAKLLLLSCLLLPFVTTLNANPSMLDGYWLMREAEANKIFHESYHPDPYNVTNHFNREVFMHLKAMDNTRRNIMGKNNNAQCMATNPIDACWRCQPNWANDRKRLANCVMGFGKDITAGKAGRVYVVTDPSDEDMVNLKPGTLRHAVIQDEPLWIIFAHPMNIKLNQELIMNSHKTIDARGANVHIANGCGITIQYAKNIIIHGLHIHDIVPGSGGLIRDSPAHYGYRTKSDGDGISIFGSSQIWIDHVSLARTADGLIDIIQASTAITISNCHMTHHDQVMLFGAQNNFVKDNKMQVTVAFNHFGKGLIQRMPRCRFGFFHIVNNDYTHWMMYAIGGSQNPTIISQGNRFIAPDNLDAKEVTKREAPESEWKSWNWISEQDYFLNGAFFRASGSMNIAKDMKGKLIPSSPGTMVGLLTQFTGPRKCIPGECC